MRTCALQILPLAQRRDSSASHAGVTPYRAMSQYAEWEGLPSHLRPPLRSRTPEKAAKLQTRRNKRKARARAKRAELQAVKAARKAQAKRELELREQQEG
jgi:hypothetical protein